MTCNEGVFMKFNKFNRAINLKIILFSVFVSHFTWANTPSEMADLSVQELFALSTDEMSEQTFEHWKVGLFYKRSNLDGYLDGTSKVSNEDVLFDGSEPRTDKNFPVLPTVINQEAYIGNIHYFFSPDENISLSIPYILQSTDHESIVPGYDEFNISSKGVGDITVNYSALLTRWENHQITFSVGFSVPTGSIDEKGDTPREAGDQQLPYTMQLGSGTWDFPFGLSYSQDTTNGSWGANAFAKLRTGKNSRDYRLGNSLAFSLWKTWNVNETLRPLMKLVYHDWGHINGQDNELLVPNPSYPYPAGITNPKFYGGQKVSAVVGSDIFVGAQKLSLELGLPIYQNLNGVQPKENTHFSLRWQSQF